MNRIRSNFIMRNELKINEANYKIFTEDASQ